MAGSTSVALSIGGTRFETTRATLSQSAFFAALLGGEDGFAAPADGVFRVDRDGAAFAGVLEYLRQGLGEMQLPDAVLESPAAVAALGREAAFYALDELRAFAMKVVLLRGWECGLPPGLLFEGRGPRAELYRMSEEAPRDYSSNATSVGEELISLFPVFHVAYMAESSGGASRVSYVNMPGTYFRAVLRYAALTGSSDESWALPRPAPVQDGVGFTFASPGRLRLQQEFDAAEATRCAARGAP